MRTVYARSHISPILMAPLLQKNRIHEVWCSYFDYFDALLIDALSKPIILKDYSIHCIRVNVPAPCWKRHCIEARSTSESAPLLFAYHSHVELKPKELQFFSIALAHFSIHCWLFQSSSHTALNRSWNDQNTIWCLQNDTTFSKLITHPSKPNISIKTYNLCSIENVCFLIYLTMDNKIQTTAINISLWIHHFNFCATPSQCWLFYQWQHTTLGFVLSTLT